MTPPRRLAHMSLYKTHTLLSASQHPGHIHYLEDTTTVPWSYQHMLHIQDTERSFWKAPQMYDHSFHPSPGLHPDSASHSLHTPPPE